MDTRMEHVEHLRAQIRDDRYEVDADAVADAIVRRLLTLHAAPAVRAADEEA